MVKLICYLIFLIKGWRYQSLLKEEPKSFVMVGAPHTSNWDFVPAMSVAFKTGHAKFVIKNEWLRFPLNLFFKPIGAIGIDRSKIKKGVVSSSTDMMAELFSDYKDLILMIAPEGTRSAAAEWKSGFWHIAHKAQVPIILGFADYKRKVAGLGMIIHPTTFEEDMRKIMSFYKTVTASDPSKFKLDQRFL
jgi:1-acyl-sn-glycerol-3-phosphate acyltransferase